MPSRPHIQVGIGIFSAHPERGEGGADALGLSVIWGAHAATCGVQKVAAWEALEGQGGTSSLHLACKLGLFGGFWFRAAAARAAPQTGRFPQA